MNRCRVLAAAVLLALPGLAAAQVYKCTDPAGRVHYSQTRPAGKECAGIDARAPPPLGTEEAAEKLKAYSKQLDEQHGEQARARQEAEQAEAVREARCTQARRRLASIGQVGTIFTVDEKGERYYKTNAQRDAMEAEARASVERECGSG